MTTIEKEIHNGTLKVNSIDATTDETLLMYAARNNNLSLAKIMHKNLANIETVNSKGENAFLIACKHENFEIVDFLLLLGTKLESSDSNGKT